MLVTAALAVLCQPALADWISIPDEDNPFASLGPGGFVANDNGQGLAVRCKNGHYVVLYLTNERIGSDQVSMVRNLGSIVKVALRFAVDSNEIFDVEAKVEVAAVQSVSLLRGDSIKLTRDAATKIAAAKRRIAVALTIGGEVTNTGTFPASGAKQVLLPLINECGQPSR